MKYRTEANRIATRIRGAVALHIARVVAVQAAASGHIAHIEIAVVRVRAHIA